MGGEKKERDRGEKKRRGAERDRGVEEIGFRACAGGRVCLPEHRTPNIRLCTNFRTPHPSPTLLIGCFEGFAFHTDHTVHTVHTPAGPPRPP